MTPEGYSMAEDLGTQSGTAWAGRTGKHKQRAFPSWRQSLRAATGSLEENFPVRESKRFYAGIFRAPSEL